MPKVITAAGSTISAEAAATVADAGGNAVDAAIAAVVVSMCTEPGIIAPAAGAFITVWAPGEEPVTIDGYCEMPGRAHPERLGTGRNEVFITYGGGMRTNVGYASVATPGAFAGFDVASERYGALPWFETLGPAIHHTRNGFPVPGVSARYLEHSHDAIFGWHPESRRVVHHADGTVIAQGEILTMPDLADSLELIARDGAEVFYTGEVGKAITDEVDGNGGILSAEDMAAYETHIRAPVFFHVDDWRLATNPPPAVGGAAMAALVLFVAESGFTSWTPETTAKIVEFQRAIFGYRGAEIEPAVDTAVKYYSTGMKLRLGFAIAAFLEPAIFIVDESLAVGDGAFQIKCINRMHELAAEGATIIFVSHELAAVEALCSQAVWLDGGRLVGRGPIGDILRDYTRSLDSQIASEAEIAADGETRCLGAVTLDKGGNPRSTFGPGDPLTVRLTFVDAGLFDDRRVSLRIRDGSGGDLIEISTDINATRAASRGTRNTWFAQCRIDSLPLNPRMYQLWCSVTGGTPSRRLLDWSEVGALRVEVPEGWSGPRRAAIAAGPAVAVSADWSIGSTG